MSLRGMSPADLDPVEAASAPIMPDPVMVQLPPAGRKRPRQWGQPQIDAHVRDTMGASMDNDEAQSVLMAQLMEQGIPRAEAMVIAARDMARAHIDSYRGRPTQPSQFERDYNEATGMPARPQAAAPSPQVDADMMPLTPDALRGLGLNPYTEPGVNMPDGTRAARPRAFENERAARAYNERPEMMPATDPSELGGTARYAPSLRDRAYLARGFAPVFTPDGRTSYQPSPDTGAEGLPGAPGRGGRRLDMEAPMLDELGNVVKDAQGNPVPKFVVGERLSPTGTLGAGEGSGTVAVYEQSQQARNRQAAYDAERRLYRMAAAAGVSPQEFYKQNADSFPDLTAGGIRQGLGARMAVQGARQDKAEDRERQWRSQMMLAGSNPAKNAVNAFNSLNDPEVNDWQKAVMAERLAPGLQGLTPLGVQAAHNAALTQLGLRVATGRGFQDMHPAQAEAIQQQVDSKKPIAQRAQEHVAAGRLNHPDVLEHANAIVSQHYSAPTALGNTSTFTDKEVMVAAQKLADQAGMPIETATSVMRGIQGERNRNATASSIVGWFYDQ